jgi:fermentation-respiration switch protein FrsA (DUF1100 family)
MKKKRKKRRKFLWFSSIITGIASVLTVIFGISLTNRIMYIEKKDDEFILDRELKANRYDEKWYNQCKKEELTIDSPNGYPIKGILLKPHPSTNHTVIICHGVTENKINSIKYARMFERLGFNSFVYDHRRHGESGGKTTSYGYYEKLDLGAVVKALKSLIGEKAYIGIHGESMGAATTILYAGTISDDADFYIADCSFSDFEELLHHIVKNSMRLKPSIPVHLADVFIRFRDGYRFKHVAPKEAVKNIEKPVLFIHSKPDAFIPAEMSIEMFELKKGPKALKLFERGAHAQSFNENPEEYEQTVREFLKKFVYR